jgi:AbrB family looped-hinge helix DNA binding protein
MKEILMVAVTVDAKGRLSIPANIREELGIETGDVLFLEMDEEHSVLHLAKSENPFDGLAAHAIEEYRQGRTISLRDYARKHDIDLDNTQ